MPLLTTMPTVTAVECERGDCDTRMVPPLGERWGTFSDEIDPWLRANGWTVWTASHTGRRYYCPEHSVYVARAAIPPGQSQFDPGNSRCHRMRQVV